MPPPLPYPTSPAPTTPGVPSSEAGRIIAPGPRAGLKQSAGKGVPGQEWVRRAVDCGWRKMGAGEDQVTRRAEAAVLHIDPGEQLSQTITVAAFWGQYGDKIYSVPPYYI